MNIVVKTDYLYELAGYLGNKGFEVYREPYAGRKELQVANKNADYGVVKISDDGLEWHCPPDVVGHVTKLCEELPIQTDIVVNTNYQAVTGHTLCLRLGVISDLCTIQTNRLLNWLIPDTMPMALTCPRCGESKIVEDLY